MGELSITLAIILAAWVYAALHPVNQENRSPAVPIITCALTVAAIATGIAAAV